MENVKGKMENVRAQMEAESRRQDGRTIRT